MHLLVAIFLARLLLVEPGQPAVMPLVEAPVLGHRDPQPVAGLEREVERLDRPRLVGGESDGRQQLALGEQAARGDGLFDALFGQADIPPAGEAVGEVPFALAVTNENEFGH